MFLQRSGDFEQLMRQNVRVHLLDGMVVNGILSDVRQFVVVIDDHGTNRTIFLNKIKGMTASPETELRG